MFERTEKWLKIFCFLLVALLLYRLAGFAFHGNPLASLKIPSVPALPVTNAPAATNVVAGKSTNAASTNVASAKTNGPALAQTNSTAATGTNSTNIATIVGTNGTIAATMVGTNGTNGTNVAVSAAKSTNATNSITGNSPTNAPTNASGAMVAGAPGARGARRGGPGGPMEPGKLGPDVPVAVRSRVDKITASEIFGPIMRPLPMGLLGIAGNEVFMRAPNGQTGMMKEGDELGGIKLLRIGTNRVLVDQDGQNKELMIFAGLGSETLMPKAKETTNEAIKKLP